MCLLITELFPQEYRNFSEWPQKSRLVGLSWHKIELSSICAGRYAFHPAWWTVHATHLQLGSSEEHMASFISCGINCISSPSPLLSCGINCISSPSPLLSCGINCISSPSPLLTNWLQKSSMSFNSCKYSYSVNQRPRWILINSW